ncbi:mitogen-activated protein kinase kinase [Plasmodiophora brassicae]
MTSGKPRLTVDVPVKPDDSFKASDTIFTTGNLHIDRSGVYRDSGSQPVASPASQASSGVLIKDIGELDLQEQLGRGSTGVVHRALHHTSGLNLAVKQISIFDKDQRRSLVKELQTLYEADCEHLVNFYGAFYDHGSIYIVLEHMQLGSLVDLLASVRRRQQQHDGHGLPEIVCAYLSKQVLLALQYLHNARHMVHRDIKPSNILLTRDARPKITDFGISTELPENAVATTFVGTCTYMSPERIIGEDYSFPSDIWSLGITIMECALGRYPYPNAGEYLALMTEITSGDVPSLPAETTSPEFRSFIDQCTQKDPGQRATADQLLGHSFIRAVTAEVAQQAQQWIIQVTTTTPM